MKPSPEAVAAAHAMRPPIRARIIVCKEKGCERKFKVMYRDGKYGRPPLRCDSCRVVRMLSQQRAAGRRYVQKQRQAKRARRRKLKSKSK